MYYARPLRLRAPHLAEIETHLDSTLPEEGCGLIAGQDGLSVQVFLIENRLHSPTQFEMHPQTLFEALEAIRVNGWTLLASFHSHPGPHGPATLSQEDQQLTAYPDSAVLLSFRRGDQWQTAAFRWLGGEPVQVPITIVPPSD